MERVTPAPGWEKLWDAYERLLASQTEAYGEIMSHAGPGRRVVLVKRYVADCEPVIRALAEIPTIPIADD